MLDYLGDEGYDPPFGARPLKRIMQRLFLNELSKEIFAGKAKKEAVVGITLNDNNEIEFLNFADYQCDPKSLLITHLTLSAFD